MTMSKTLIVVVGPTGSGKSDLAVDIAKRLDAQIMSTDSRQFYKGMAIGTAQPTKEQLLAVPHHFIASHQITDQISCGRYEKMAMELLEELFIEDDFVVAVGGSGLYIDALCRGMDSMPDIDEELRAELKQRVEIEGMESLLEQLKELDPQYYDIVDRSNRQRVIRGVEVCLQTGTTFTSLRMGEGKQRPFRVVKIGVDMPRDVLYDRINRRVDTMLEQGLEQEVRSLIPYRNLNSLQTVGYREMFSHFDGDISFDRSVELIKQNSRHYAKRQMTWFRRDDQIKWVDPLDVTAIEALIALKK